jgi:hypothetical protein
MIFGMTIVIVVFSLLLGGAAIFMPHKAAVNMEVS